MSEDMQDLQEEGWGAVGGETIETESQDDAPQDMAPAETQTPVVDTPAAVVETQHQEPAVDYEKRFKDSQAYITRRDQEAARAAEESRKRESELMAQIRLAEMQKQSEPQQPQGFAPPEDPDGLVNAGDMHRYMTKLQSQQQADNDAIRKQSLQMQQDAERTRLTASWERNNPDLAGRETTKAAIGGLVTVAPSHMTLSEKLEWATQQYKEDQASITAEVTARVTADRQAIAGGAGLSGGRSSPPAGEQPAPSIRDELASTRDKQDKRRGR